MSCSGADLMKYTYPALSLDGNRSKCVVGKGSDREEVGKGGRGTQEPAVPKSELGKRENQNRTRYPVPRIMCRSF